LTGVPVKTGNEIMSAIVKQINRLPFAPLVGGMYATAAGYLAISTPMWLMEKWVAGTGLPSVLAAAQAPLGAKARLLVVTACFVGTGLIAWVAARQIDARLSKSRPKAKQAAPTVQSFAPPAADAQGQTWFAPEAQSAAPAESADSGFARPPIFAGRDLGAPFMAEDQPVQATAPQPVEVPAAPIAAVPVEMPFFEARSLTIPFREDVAPIPEQDELILDEFQVADIPHQEDLDPEIAETQSHVEIPLELAPTAAVAPAPEMATPTDPSELAGLMGRFETGIRRRQLSGLVAQALPDTPKSNEIAADEALRDALGTLERLAATAR
jgi:hypothetical protein